MIRSLLVAAMAAAAVVTAPAALAQPSPQPAPPPLPQPQHWDGDVPGIVYGAALHGPCTNWQTFVFGRGRDGQAVACHWIPNQNPPVTTGFWVISPPLYGVAEVGAPCPNPRGAAAQSPDGRPLACRGEMGWQAGRLTGKGFLPE